MSKFEYTVTKKDEELPIKELLRRHFTFSRRLLGRLKRSDSIFLNGVPARTFLVPAVGDVITVVLPDEQSHFLPEPIKISPVYEDSALLIIDKQPGFVVHPTNGHPLHTIANGIAQYMIDTDQLFKIRFINRLDMDTSGILVIAKNAYSQDSFIKQMKEKKILKHYIAVVKGIIPDDKGTVSLPLGRPDPERVERGVMVDGYPSTTHYEVLERFSKGYTLVELLLETGRTHQIRVHMSHIGYPVVCDHLYGEENVLLIERHALHAKSISFYHPVTGDLIEVSAPMPEDILALIEKLR